ncbi:MAG: deoxyhypusine synthase family protein [Thermoplasmata archaeon]
MPMKSVVESLNVKRATISELLKAMSKTAYQGRTLGRAVEIIESMIRDESVTIMFGYAGSLSTAGQWKIVKWFIERGYIDVLVSTGANISEDIVEAMGFNYYHLEDDQIGSADGQLFERGYNRYYDIVGKESDYLEMTELICEFMTGLEEDSNYSSRSLLGLFGNWLSERKIDCILSAAARHSVPVFCPAIVDSPYGDAALLAHSKGHKVSVDNVKDYIEFMRLAERIDDTGVILVGGGVPKDFIQLFAATADLLYEGYEVPGKEGKGLKREGTDESYYPHKYAVQITMDSPQWGGLSGATLEEAISWGKESADARIIVCYCDATIALPLIAHSLDERLEGYDRRRRSAGVPTKD